ncbi:MAG: energy transducer TonB [Acidobacteriota bacterium]|nr:energy transducer TonB [Acidobacteriota bacterium]
MRGTLLSMMAGGKLVLSLVLVQALASATAQPPGTDEPHHSAAHAAAQNDAAPEQGRSAKLCAPDDRGLYDLRDREMHVPVLTHQKNPKYSKAARAAKVSGVTLVALVVNVQGKPERVHIRRSLADGVGPELRESALSLDDAAAEAVRSYRFKPATCKGEPVPVEMNVEVNFQIF